MRTPLTARSTLLSPKKNSLRPYNKSIQTEPAQHQKYNFSELTNITTIVKDVEIKERRNTCNTFLKNKELKEFVQNSFMKNSALYEIKRDLTFEQLTALQTLSSLDWKKKPADKKGRMLINELWSDKHYKTVVNSSDLKPKTDLLKIQKKIKLFSEMLKDIDIAYKKIKKFNQKEQMDIINTYFNEGGPKSPAMVRPSTMNRKSSATATLYQGRANRSQLHSSSLIGGKSQIQNMNFNFPQSIMNYEKNMVSCSLEDLLQKLEMFAKLESTEKSMELKKMFRKVMNEKMEGIDVSNERELKESLTFRNRMMSQYKLNKHSRGKQSSLLSQMQLVSSPRKKTAAENENAKEKRSIENIINDNVNYAINLNTFNNKNTCKPIGFKRDLFKRSNTKSEDKTLKKTDTEEFDSDDEFNIYQIQKTTFSPEQEEKEGKPIKKEIRISSFGRNLSTFLPPNLQVRPLSARDQAENNTKNLITRCENFTNQNFELIKQINIGLKLKEIDKEFKKGFNREEKILEDINKFVNQTRNKMKYDLSKKEKEKAALKKMVQAYYVGFDSDQDQDS